MLKFKDFLYTKDLYDLEQLTEAIDDHQPLNGRWNQPLTPDIDHAIYKFDVPGDNCGPGCYAVNIKGNPNESISISFSRNDSYEDQYKGFGPIVFKGVLKALGEYITKLKPKSLFWGAAKKNTPHPETGKIVNQNARTHVYDGWALRNLFPDNYVGIKGQWVRRDIYDSQYVPQGFPPVPEEITKDSPSGVKKEALEKMRQEYQEVHKKRITNREEEQKQKTQEKLISALNNPQINPEGIKEGDVVFLRNPELTHNFPSFSFYKEKPAKIIKLKFYSDDDEDSDILAIVNFSNSDDINSNEFYGAKTSFRITDLVKATPEAIEKLHRRREEDRYQQEKQRQPFQTSSFTGTKNKIINSEQQPFKIGDFVSVISGTHQGESGLITGFRVFGQNIFAIIKTHNGNFDINAKEITKIQPVATESLSFFRYLTQK